MLTFRATLAYRHRRVGRGGVGHDDPSHLVRIPSLAAGDRRRSLTARSGLGIDPLHRTNGARATPGVPATRFFSICFIRICFFIRIFADRARSADHIR